MTKNILKPAFDLFILRQRPFADFDFPRWQSLFWLGLTILTSFGTPQLNIKFLFKLISMSGFIWFMLIFLRWWMKRDGRWDGHGDFFNLLTASWLIGDVISTGLMFIGTPTVIVCLFGLYCLWVASNGLSGAIPKANLSYSLIGVLLSLVAGMIFVSLLSVVFFSTGLFFLPSHTTSL